jgi:cell fate (sporulation/competence/biofilm development) regulator YlbF (YheA/YmcA/DUF963 family)
LFWTPFDEKFSEILGRFKRHQEEFRNLEHNVYSVELIRNFNLMQEERQKASQHREMFIEQREIAERKAIGMSFT